MPAAFGDWSRRAASPRHSASLNESFGGVSVTSEHTFETNTPRRTGAADERGLRLEQPAPRHRPRTAARHRRRAGRGRVALPRAERPGREVSSLTRWDAPADGQPRYTAAKGGKRGLIFPADGLPAYAGTSLRDPILVAEGASDTACLHTFAFTAVGAPMAGRGGDELAVLLRDRHVVLIGDNDTAGRKSIQTLAAALVGVCASVRFTFPPDGHKDVRRGSPTAGPVMRTSLG